MQVLMLDIRFFGRKVDSVMLENDLLVGRSKDANIRLMSADVSRRHCRILRQESGFVEVIDLESRNGIEVNGEPTKYAVLALNDTIKIGCYSLTLVEHVPANAMTEAI